MQLNAMQKVREICKVYNAMDAEKRRVRMAFKEAIVFPPTDNACKAHCAQCEQCEQCKKHNA